MLTTAKLRYLKIAPRKVRLVADSIRGKNIEEAQAILSFSSKRACQSLLKLLKSALANAKSNFDNINEKNLYISRIFVDEGPKMKRWRAQSRGRAAQIQNKSSHVSLELSLIEGKAKKIKKSVKEKQKLVEEKPVEEKKEEKATEVKEKPKTEVKRDWIQERAKPRLSQKMKIFRRKSF